MAFMFHAHPQKQAENYLRVAEIFIQIKDELVRRP